ncbi:MAG TPA: nucleotide sugar dehydrogenase [Candidatus Binatia bacterium]|jgi:UDP-N-acetyl-D-glucosamine dehydrogenase
MTQIQSGLAVCEEHQTAKELAKKIHDRTARVGVIGLGYVGLPLGVEMAKQGFQFTGIDIDRQKVDSVNAGISHILDVPNETLLSLVAQRRIKATQSLAAVENLDTVSVCVPTPLRKTKEPDLSYVIAAAEAIRNHLQQGQLIVIESTTYPGTTREVVLPILEKSGLKVGSDFFLAFSPERVDPGNKNYTTRNIPKVIGGMTPQCAELAALLYSQFVERIVPVSTPECAEMVKLLENTFRSVNIALANEMALLCNKLNVDVWEVIDAANTKPFGFMPFYPGPGLGGHCIPVDPYYLTWKARLNGCEPRFIELAGQINSQMPAFTVTRVADVLNDRQKSLKASKILGLGVAYKRDTSDTRESPAIEVLHGLMERGAHVQYSDPYVPSLKLGDKVLQSVTLKPALLRACDCVVVLTDHSTFDYAMVATHSPVIVDTRNALKNFSGPNLVRL